MKGKGGGQPKDTGEEMAILDAMIVSLVDMLEEKGLLTHEDWDIRVKNALKQERKLTDIKELLKR